METTIFNFSYASPELPTYPADEVIMVECDQCGCNTDYVEKSVTNPKKKLCDDCLDFEQDFIIANFYPLERYIRFKKVKRIVDSCTTEHHNEVAAKVIALFNKKYSCDFDLMLEKFLSYGD